MPGCGVLRDVRLPGDPSRWDFMAYDATVRRLYLAHLGASQIVVFDTIRNQTVRTIDGVDNVHGLVLAPELGRLFASATGAHGLQLDLPERHRTFIACAGDARLLAVDVATGAVPRGGT